MRCFFIVESRDDGSVAADARLDLSSVDTMAERQEGVMFRDWLLSVIAGPMMGEEDESVDISRGTARGRRRITFSYRRNRSGGSPFWEMAVPGDVELGLCPDDVGAMFSSLSLSFMSHGRVSPGRSVERFLARRGIRIQGSRLSPEAEHGSAGTTTTTQTTTTTTESP